MTHKKKLIEVALPLDAINKASAREKSIRHGHPSTLHLWWARRPLAAARAVIFAQMVDDPSAHPDLFPTPKAQEKERRRLFRIIEDLVLWENTTNEKVLQQARDEIWQSWRYTCAENADHPRARELFDRHKLPAFHDPFAGGGALPLEAQRLGLESYASDLNPVAVLINKAMIEIPPKFAGRPPVSLGARASSPQQPQQRRLPMPEARGWHSRGYLPHLDQPGLVQSVTFRLHDAVPMAVLAQWKQELGCSEASPANDQRSMELRKRIDHYEDQGHGSCRLHRADAAEIVQQALFHFDGQRYRLLAWCVMPNHVHVLIETLPGYLLAELIHGWKSFSANAINRLTGAKGPFWMPDYYDRFIRDERHLHAARDYIENNPVKVGLVEEPALWHFSSASMRSMRAGSPRSQEWHGAQGLAEDVRYYGKWMRDEAEKRIGHLYPKAEVTVEMAKERPDLKKYVGRKLTVIAWLWARTVKSPNPAFAQVDVPLASTFMLSTKAGKEAYVEPVIEDGGYLFTVKVSKPKNAEAAKNGTKLARANFLCLMSGSPISGDYIKAEGKAGRMGARLMAIVAEGERGRVYLPPTEAMEEVALQAQPEWKPEGDVPARLTGGTCVPYGLARWGDLFTPRQLVALTTFSDLVQDARERVKRDGLAAGLSEGGNGFAGGGSGATAYADSVAVYLALAVDKVADRNSTVCAWACLREHARNTFGRQALPMVWDFAESNPLSESSGNFEGGIVSIVAALGPLNPTQAGHAEQADGQSQEVAVAKVVSTDPPYYDNIGYADLSDFFYVWLRRALRPVFPDLFATLAVPKAEELVATAYRHGSKEKAEIFFLKGMTLAMHRLAEQAHPAFPVTIYYAFKQAEGDGADGTTNTGWDTFLAAVIEAGFAISGTWPMRTELVRRMIGSGTNALASSIILVCRKRSVDASTATRREFVAALKADLPVALTHLQRGNIAPVDLAQAAIGPGMAVYTRYSKVLDAEGKPLSVREALALINQTLDEALAEQEGDFDADSRWALAWFEQSGFAEGEYGVAEILSKAKNTSVSGMVDAGILASKGGKVRLLRPDELSADWDPEKDKRLTAWEMVHQLIRAIEGDGEPAAATLVAKLGSNAEIARELAYRLYTLCERRKRAAEALSYNGLVQSWPEIMRLAQEERRTAPVQMNLFGDHSSP
jgi:putative DNA methylase